jgi:uncharacterized membrane protein
MRVAFAILTLLYPLSVYLATTRGYLGITAALLAVALMIKVRTGSTLTQPRSLIVALSVGAIALVASHYLPTIPLYYPFVVNLVLLTIFTTSLIRPPSIIERFATITQGPLPAEGQRYCRRVCQVWVAFFVTNTIIAFDSLHRSLEWWSLYNGCISYLIMGTLFVVEYLIRLRVMRRIHPIISSLLLAALAFPISRAYAEPTLDLQQIRQHLKPATPFRSTFREERRIAALTAPLSSSGEMRCLPQRGIEWRMKHPVERTTIITPSGLKVIDRIGASEQVSDRANISAALLSLMGGDLQEAAEDFMITASGSVNAWMITLTPKDSLVAEIVAKIVVQGSDRPEVLEVHHANTDTIITSFAEPIPLSESEVLELQTSLNEAL